MIPQTESGPAAAEGSARAAADPATSELRDLDRGPFNVREFARTARGSHRAALELDGLEVDAEAAHLIRILRDLERSTMHRMRNLLVTATHKDARVTAFLTTWAFEKFWLADALDAVLEATGHDLATPEGKPRRSLRERVDRRGPVARAIAGNLDGPRLVAAHVTIGLVDEWVTSAAYHRLGELAASLRAIVDLVLEVKARHIAFLLEEAQRRLAESPRAVRLSARTVRQTAWPVGATERSADDRGFFERVVFGDAAGRAAAAAIGDRISALPGLIGVGPVVAARLSP